MNAVQASPARRFGWNARPAASDYRADAWERTTAGPKLSIDLKDAVTPSGFIALQVHAVGKSEEPREVCFRNLRIKELKEAH